MDGINSLSSQSNVTYLLDFMEQYHSKSTSYKILELKYDERRFLSNNILNKNSLLNNEEGHHINPLTLKNLVASVEDGKQVLTYDSPENHREQEYDVIHEHDMEIYVLLENDLQFEAYLSLIKTTFILFIIMVSALLISKDATALVLQPLETIMMKVNEMAEDPFQILKFSEIEAAVEKDK